LDKLSEVFIELFLEWHIIDPHMPMKSIRTMWMSFFYLFNVDGQCKCVRDPIMWGSAGNIYLQLKEVPRTN